MHRQGSRLPLTPEAFGAGVSQAAAAFGFTLLEAAHFGHGATVGVRKVAGGLKGLLRMGVRKVLARHGWQLEEGGRYWHARRADGAVSVDGTSAREVVALARQFPVDLQGLAKALEGRRTEARRAAEEAQAWKALFLRALALLSFRSAQGYVLRCELDLVRDGELCAHELPLQRIASAVTAPGELLSGHGVADRVLAKLEEQTLALSDAHERAARAELDRDKAQNKATELAVQLEEQADRVEKLLAEVEEERGQTNAARTQVRQLEEHLQWLRSGGRKQ